VTNAGVSEADLPFVYLDRRDRCAGDRAPRRRLERQPGQAHGIHRLRHRTAVAALAMTTLPRSPLFVAMLVLDASVRGIIGAHGSGAGSDASAANRACAQRDELNASVQQLAAGGASLAASLIVGRSAGGS